MSDTAVTGGVQRADRDTGVVLRHHEHHGARIGFGGHEECIGERAVEDLRPRPGQPVCVPVRRRLHRAFAHVAVQSRGDDLVAVDRRHRPRLLQCLRAEPGQRARGEHGRLQVWHRGHLPAERDEHRDLLQHSESPAAQRLRSCGGQDVGVPELGPQVVVEAFVEPVQVTLALGRAHRLGDGADQPAEILGGFGGREIHVERPYRFTRGRPSATMPMMSR